MSSFLRLTLITLLVILPSTVMGRQPMTETPPPGSETPPPGSDETSEPEGVPYGTPETPGTIPDPPDGYPENPDGDDDGDGLPNDFEHLIGTDPDKADTDGGGIEDMAEIVVGTDPLDASDDYLTPDDADCHDLAVQELQDLNSDLNELWDDLCEELSFHLTLQADIRRLWYAVSLFRYFHGDEFEDFILDSDYEELGTFMFGDEFGSLGWRMQIAWNCMVDGFHMCITLGRVKSDVETLMSNGQWCLALDRIRVLQHGCQLGQGALEAAQDHHDIAEGMLDVAWDEWWIFLDALVDYYDWLAEQAADEIIVIIPTNGAPYWSDIADALDWIINGD